MGGVAVWIQRRVCSLYDMLTGEIYATDAANSQGEVIKGQEFGMYSPVSYNYVKCLPISVGKEEVEHNLFLIGPLYAINMQY